MTETATELPMRTLADIKRRMVPGTRLEVTEQTKRPVLVGTCPHCN